MRRYAVKWHTPGNESMTHSSNVLIVDGYSTMEDIPRIIATARTGDPNLAYLIIVDSVEFLSEEN